VALIVKMPVAVFTAYPDAYNVQLLPGGEGTDARNGPAICPWALVAATVSAARVAGGCPMWLAYVVTAEASVRTSA
jgi:hypothetical protein